MSTLEKLISQLCPDGVEYKQMGKVAKVCRGVRVVKAQLSKVGKYPVYQNSITPLGYHLERNCKAGTTFVIAAGAAGEIGYCNVDFWAADDCYYIETDKNLNGRFVYYCLLTMRLQLTSKVRKASVPRLARSFVDNLVIPFPPLPVQKEIVRMLDDMAGLIDALEEELAARKKQYEWCRERLLRIKDGDESYKLSLGEVCEVLDNSRVPVSRKNRKVGPYPYYGANGIQDYVDSYIFDGTFLLIGEDGSVINGDGSPVLNWVEGKVWVNNHAHVLKGTDKADLRYLFYILQTIDISAMVRGTPPKLNQENLKRITVMLPPLSEQRRIVKILDNIDTVCNSMTEGLPGEIALRKQQYEYYRDKLLAFKRAG